MIPDVWITDMQQIMSGNHRAKNRTLEGKLRTRKLKPGKKKTKLKENKTWEKFRIRKKEKEILKQKFEKYDEIPETDQTRKRRNK